MKRILKLFTFPLILGSFFLSFVFFNSAKTPALATASPRNITNIGILVKFTDSDSIVSTKTDGTPIHLDDAESIANAQKLLNSDQPISMQITSNANTQNISVPSLKTYYETQSYGKLSVTTELFPRNNQQIISYQDPKKFGYYLAKSNSNPEGYTNNTEKSEREAELVNNAINRISAEIANTGLNAGDLDTDGDGKIDAVTLFIEGADEKKYNIPRDSIFWSHVNSNTGNISAKILGKSIDFYALIYGPNHTAYNGTFSLNTGSYGTIIHEFGHILGFKDLYRSLANPNKPVEYFDIMGSVTSSNPQNFLSYFTSEYHAATNWHDPLPVIKNSTTVTLSKPNFSDPSEKRAVKIQASSSNPKEYFIAEYYEPHDQRPNFASKDKGVIIYRINENNRNSGNYNNDDSGKSDLVYIFRPGENNPGAGQGELALAPLNSSRPTFGKTLSTNQDFDNQTIYYSDGSNSGIIVEVINETTDSITLKIKFPETVGDGSQSNPYLISDPTMFIYHLQGDTTGKYYRLTSDLDFQDITYPELSFFGHLDGDGKTLRNISVVNAGVFNEIGKYGQNSSVKNLKVENLTATSSSGDTSLGGLSSTVDYATIENVQLLSGSVTNGTATLNALASTGGLIGNAGGSTIIKNCSSNLTVTAPKNAGGLIGLNMNAKIINSHVSGKVNSGTNAGAFIGVQNITNLSTYQTPSGCTYDQKQNPSLPTVGAMYDESFKSPTSELLQGITGTTSPTDPPKPPVVLSTETEILQRLGLTKSESYLTGFELDTPVQNLRQTISNLEHVDLVYLKNNTGQEISSGIISTGIEFAIKIGDSTHQYTTVIKGDVNGDGKIQATDYVKVRNHIMGKTTLTGAYLKAADANQDGKVYATDYVKIRNHIMGKTIIEQK